MTRSLLVALRTPQPRPAGFTLIELMVAIALGLLVSIGIVSLFQGTSYTNRVQAGLATIQENGRYAMGRFNDDIRSAAHQMVSVTNSPQASKDTTTASSTNGILSPLLFPDVYITSFVTETAPTPPGGGGAATGNALHDAPSKLLGVPPTTTGWPGSRAFPLGSSVYIQGYECNTGTSCTPSVPTMIPAAAATPTAGRRVAGTDVLTIRYLDDDGWPLQVGSSSVVCTAGALTSLTLTPRISAASAPPYLDGEKPLNFVTNDLMLVASTGGSFITQVSVTGGTTSQTLTPINVIPGTTIPCPVGASSPGIPLQSVNNEMRVFNFSRDFRTVTYFLQYMVDPNPDYPNRLIPTLMRRIDGVAQPLVSGVDRLDFLYVVEDGNGTNSYLTAATVNSRSSAASAPTYCPPVPDQYQVTFQGASPAVFDPDCLWRAVKSVEVHMLLNSVNNIGGLTGADMAYHYSLLPVGASAVDYTSTSYATPGSTSSLPTGALAGSMLRREVTGTITIRNFAP